MIKWFIELHKMIKWFIELHKRVFMENDPYDPDQVFLRILIQVIDIEIILIIIGLIAIIGSLF